MGQKTNKVEDVQVERKAAHEGKEKDEVQKRIGEFALLHVASVAGFAGDLACSLVEDETSKSLLAYDPEYRRELLLDQIVSRLDYCLEGLADLRAAGLLPGGEKAGCFFWYGRG